MRLLLTREVSDGRLQIIMEDIHAQSVRYDQEEKYTYYLKGANIDRFIKVADTILAYGVK